MRCRSCLLPAAAPGSDLDKDHICAYCRNPQLDQKEDVWEANKSKHQNELEEILNQCRISKSKYQALVCLSGGKDSLMLLYKLKVEEKLRVLALTTDINIPPIAWENIRQALKTLEIDHLVYRPSAPFYSKLFRYLLSHQEKRGAVYTLSYVYAPLFEGDALDLATRLEIPAIFAGYSPGQPEAHRMLFQFSRKMIEETDWVPPQIRKSGVFSETELNYFWNAKKFPFGTKFPYYVAPFHAWDYNQDSIMKKVVQEKLAVSSSAASPIRSNYPINWLLMYSDIKNFGYNPYAPEFSRLIRQKKASLTYWKIMAPIVDTMIKNKIFLGAEVAKSMKELSLKDEDLVINLPQGAYDP